MATSASAIATSSVSSVNGFACLRSEDFSSLKTFSNSSALFNASNKSVFIKQKNVGLQVFSAQRGTQIFRSNKKKDDDEESSAPKKPAFGTQLFRFNKKAEEEDDEEESAPKKPAFGTQLFRFNKKAEEEEEEVEEKPSKSNLLSLAKVQDLPGISVFQRRQADPSTVFVAGATGQTGARISLELLHAGFKVRAGVSDIEEAQKLAEIASAYGLITKEEAKKLNVVEFNANDVELIAKAVGNASKVVISVGDSENGPSAKFSNKDALVVVKAAELAKVSNLILISTGDGSSSGSPINFFTRIFSFFQNQQSVELSTEGLIEKIAETDLKFTVIKAGSSAGVVDSFSSSSNVVISEEGTAAAEGKVSRLQIASVVAEALTNIALTENKVFDVTASESAPAKSLEEYFSGLPEDGRRQSMALASAKLIAEEKEKATKAAAMAEAEAAKAQANAAAKLAKALELEAKQLAEQEARAAAVAEKAAAQAEAAKVSVDSLEEKVNEVDQIIPKSTSSPFPSFNISELTPRIKAGTQKFAFDKLAEGFDLESLTSKFKVPEKKPVAEAEKPVAKPVVKPAAKPAPKPVAETLASKPKRTLRQRLVKPVVAKPVEEPKPEKPVEKKKVLGGLFTQDTIFMDDE